MKLKTILFISIIFILVFVIYLTTIDKKVYYLDISIDNNNYSYSNYVYKYLKKEEKLEKYIYGFTTQDDRVTDIIYMINQVKMLFLNLKRI